MTGDRQAGDCPKGGDHDIRPVQESYREDGRTLLRWVIRCVKCGQPK
jgi:hypothetical protein